MAAATMRLYLSDPHAFEADATVVAVSGDALACDRTCFYPGGGGQPPDRGTVVLPGATTLPITSALAHTGGLVWHVAAAPPAPALVGARVRLVLDRERRVALARYHTALHVLNTTALRDYRARITGVQIGVDYSRID